MERPKDKIKVLVVDDSPFIRRLLSSVLKGDPDIEVIGEAENGEEAIEKTLKLKPDIILMDIVMPVMDGLQATQKIMSVCPTPILIVSSVINKAEAYTAFNALAMGAVDVLLKPNSNSEWQKLGKVLIRKVKLFSQMKPFKKRETKVQSISSTPRLEINKYKIVGIGASTGGPNVLKEILTALPFSFSLPILVVQHMSPSFIKPMIEWLNKGINLKIKLAEHGELAKAGTIYVAPPDKHLKVNKKGLLVLDAKKPPVNGHRPSVDVLFKSLAKTYGSGVVGVLLTGMGEDGALGLKAIKEKGGYTIVQDEATCIIFGMPKAAVELGAATKVLNPSQIARELLGLAGVKK